MTPARQTRRRKEVLKRKAFSGDLGVVGGKESGEVDVVASCRGVAGERWARESAKECRRAGDTEDGERRAVCSVVGTS